MEQVNERDTLGYLFSLKVLDQQENLKKAIESVSLEGDWAEFGVSSGGTARVILGLMPPNVYLYLFDSFLGLPEDWICNGQVFGRHHKGDYGMGLVNLVDKRIKVIAGLFCNTVSEFARLHQKPLAFIHIDCDLYSSSRDVMEGIGGLIAPNTIIVFDDYHSYAGNGWKEHGYKAFQEFAQSRQYKYIARGDRQASIKMT